MTSFHVKQGDCSPAEERLGLQIKQRIVILAVGTAISLFLFLRMNAWEYWAIPLLPLGCGILYFLFPSVLLRIPGNAGASCLNIVVVLRYLVSPLLLGLQGFLPSRGAVPNAGEVAVATALMLYELAAVFVVLHLFGGRLEREGCCEVRKTNPGGPVVLVVAGTTAAAVFPQILEKYSFLFSSQEFVRERLEIPGAAELLFQFGVLFGMLKLVERLSRHPACCWRFFCAAGLVTAAGSFVPYSSRFGILLPFLAGWLVLRECFPPFRRLLSRLLPLLLAGLLLFSTLKKEGGSDSGLSKAAFDLARNASQTLQSYFSGITNVALSVRMKTVYAGCFSPGILFSDLCKSVMGVSGIFAGNTGTTELFNLVFYGERAARDQIVPMIGQGYCFFGFVLAPVFSALSALLAVRFDALRKRSGDVFSIYLYGYLSVRFGLFLMVNASILTAELTNLFLPILLLRWCNDRLTIFPKGGVS